MDGERAAEGVERVPVVAELLQDDAEAGERAEMARLARKHLADVGKRPPEVFLGEIYGGAPVPGLDEVRLDLDDGVEKLDREIVILPSTAVLTRLINRFAVSLGEASQIAQIRPSTYFALSSSGAALRASNRRSRFCVLSPR